MNRRIPLSLRADLSPEPAGRPVWPVCLIVCLIVFLCATSNVLPQADISNAVLKGKVVDQNGSSIQGALITISDPRRGVVRTVNTDVDGEYRLSLLQPGNYDVRVEAPGFQTQVLKNIVLTVGQIAVRDVQLQIGPIANRVEVVDSPAIVDSERTQQSDTIEQRQIVALPNLSRNFTSYIFTLPGISDVATARVQQSRVTPIPTSGFSVGANNGRYNLVTIDGGENESGTGNLRIRNMSVEAVQEFQVNRNAFSAEFGFTASTAINVITRSGTNQYHGSIYGFYRSQNLGAKDPLNTTGKKASERRISPGFTFEGPFVKEKAFFFTSFEALKYDVARLRAYTNVPSLLSPTNAQLVYLQNLSSGPNATDASRAIASRLQSALTTTNYATTMDILRQSEGQFNAPTRTYNWTTHVDYTRSDRDLFNGRFTLALENIDQLGAANIEAPSNGILQTAYDYTTVVTWDHKISNNVWNQFRVQFALDQYKQVSHSPASTDIVIAGLISYGRQTTIPFIIKQDRYQFDDSITWSRGTSEVKAGGSYRPVDAHITTEIGFGGVFQFVGGQPLSRALLPTESTILTGPLAPPADTVLTSLQAFNLGIAASWQQGFGHPSFQAWQHSLGAFVQYSWKPTSRLSFNIGGRLNYDGEPKPFGLNATISPRIGFAWDPFGKGKTVIRGGFGTFYAPVGLQVLLSATLQSSSGKYINLQSLTLQSGEQSSATLWAFGVGLGRLPFTALTEQQIRDFGVIPGPGQFNRRIVDAAPDYHNPYTVQASLGLSQYFAKDLLFNVAMQMYHGVHLPIALEGNYRESGQFVPVSGMPGSDLFGPQLVRIDPSISQYIVHSSVGNSIYYGLNVSLERRFGRLFQFRTSYTYSKAIDDVVDFSSGTTPYIPTRRYLERGLSAYDQRNNFVASASVESPFKHRPGKYWIKRVLSDMSLSPIVVLRSGFPFNLYIGRDVNGDLNTTDRPFHASRNSGIGEKFYSVDLRLIKWFRLTGRDNGPKLELIAEGMNILNRANYIRVNDIVCGTTSQSGFINGCDPKFLTGPFDFHGVAGLPPSSPLAFVAAAPARQFQIGLKFEM